MTEAPRHRLARGLGDLTTGGSFSASCRSPLDDLSIEVTGVGPLRIPVTAAQALELRRVARPARYGRGEATLLDRRVRDTWEVPRSRVRIDRRRWNRTLGPALDGLRADLGLPEGSRLKADLHSMLVYEANQFFAPHQDSEKADDMVGTLVVVLPSNATGGELVVRHRGLEVSYSSSRSLVTLVALYADTVHEVKPLRSGHRVVLTYNLRLVGDRSLTPAPVPASAVVEAVDLLERHFTEAADVPAWRRDIAPGEPPDRLVYLLDHEYTQATMSWSRLKGDDSVRAGVLRSAAEELDLEMSLALAEVHEIWNCFEDDRRYRRSRQWDDDYASGDDLDGLELTDLIDAEVVLHRPRGRSGAGPTFAPAVGEHELCESTPSLALEPYQSEFEGYTGNAGNTMDRWYRRGAVVLWPRSRAFAVLAKGNPAAALTELLTLGRSGRADAGFDPGEIRRRVAMLAPFWGSAVRGADDSGSAGGSSLLARSLKVADLVDDAELAATLVGPFRIEQLTPAAAEPLVALARRYGIDWLAAQLSRWAGVEHRWSRTGRESRAGWLASLPTLSAALCAGSTAIAPDPGGAGSPPPGQAPVPTGVDAAQAVVSASWNWLAGALTEAAALERPRDRLAALEDLGPALAGVLEATARADAIELRDTIVAVVCGGGDGLLPALIAALDAAHQLEPEVLAGSGLGRVARHSADRLEAFLARPQREPDDWSIEVPVSWHACEDCATLAGFLADAGRRILEWPLAKPRRQHIHQVLERFELPVTHETRRTGRPFPLVLKKTDALIKRDQQLRQRAALDLVTVSNLL